MKEESQPGQSVDLVRKKKPTIVGNTNNKGSSKKRSRNPSDVRFMETLEDNVENQVETKSIRFESRHLSKYEQLRERNIVKIQNLRKVI